MDDYPVYRSSQGDVWTKERIQTLKEFLSSEGFISNGIYGGRSRILEVGPAIYMELNYRNKPGVFAVALTPYMQEAVWIEEPRVGSVLFTQYDNPGSVGEEVLKLLYICLQRVYGKESKSEVTNGSTIY